MSLLGKRSINLVVGIFTMTGEGLMGALSLLTAYASSFIIGKTINFILYIHPFVTLLDPFHVRYGKVLAGIMAVVSVLNDITWMPITLTGLGK